MRRPLARISAVVSLLGVLASLLVVGTAAQDATPATTGTHPLVGTWIVDADVDDPANAPEVDRFFADGGFLSIDATGRPTLGLWEATGERTATVTFISTGSDDTGAYVGTFTVRAEVEVDAAGDVFTGDYTIEIAGPDGSSPGEFGPGRVEGKRLTSEAPGSPAGSLGELFGGAAGTPEAGTPAP
jgi:hypothetical protein